MLRFYTEFQLIEGFVIRKVIETYGLGCKEILCLLMSEIFFNVQRKMNSRNKSLLI